MTIQFVLVLFTSYPIALYYTNLDECIKEFDKYSKMGYNVRDKCITWDSAVQRGYVPKRTNK